MTHDYTTIFDDARHFARELAALDKVNLVPLSSLDWKAAYISSFASGADTNRTPLDGAGEKEAMLRYLRDAHGDLVRERPKVAARWWSIWQGVRLQGVKIATRPTGLSVRQIHNILEQVDAYVDQVLDYHNVLRVRPPRVRTAINPGAFDE